MLAHESAKTHLSPNKLFPYVGAPSAFADGAPIFSTMSDDAMTILSRGTDDIISADGLKEKLTQSQKTKKPLIIKAGFDPTAPDIHLGHWVLLRKLRQFQDLGHTVYFLIGDFTARIGDPTGNDKLRPKMTDKEITQNASTYKKQVFKILDKNKTKIVFNSKWLSKLNIQELLELTEHCTVAQMLHRSDFKKRYQESKEITLLEFVYPLMQGYDSVHMKADVELGGTDQRFNLLMGRQLQEVYGQEPQIVMMTPLLEGTDGVKKMSKSLGNYIGINEPPKEIFGKVMSISDELMLRWFEILTNEDLEEVKQQHPKEAKVRLAKGIIEQFYSSKEADKAAEEFDRTFSQHLTPDDIQEYGFSSQNPENLTDVLIKAKVVDSKNEVRRLLKQGAITHEGQKIDSEDWALQAGVLKIGKKRFLKLINKS